MKKFNTVFSKTILMAVVLLLTVSGCKKDPFSIAPKACIDGVPSTAEANAVINFSSACSEGVVSVLWSFGDGTSSLLPTINHSYNGAGTFTVTLTVTNEHGVSSTTKTITVTDSRVKFLGSYSAVDTPGPYTYTLDITNGVAAYEIFLSNDFCGHYFSHVLHATVNGNTFTIPFQEPDNDGLTVEGSGTINNKTITVVYTVGPDEHYTGTWVKP